MGTKWYLDESQWLEAVNVPFGAQQYLCCGFFRSIPPSRCLVIALGVIVTKYEGSFLWDRFANVIFSVASYSMIYGSTIDFCNTVMQENGWPHISL